MNIFMRTLFMMLLCALAVCVGLRVKARTSEVELEIRNEQAGQSARRSEALPSDYVLAIDCSGSMRRQLDPVIELGRAIISRNSPDDQTMLLRFINSPQVVEDFTSDRAALEEGLDSLYIEG